MLVKPDFSEVADPITPGEYKVIIKKGEVKEWPNGGTYVNWELETVGDADPKNNGRKIFDKTALTGRGAFRIQQFYQAATGQALTKEFDTEQLAGKQIVVEVIDGMRNGEPTGYTEVKRYKRA